MSMIKIVGHTVEQKTENYIDIYDRSVTDSYVEHRFEFADHSIVTYEKHGSFLEKFYGVFSPNGRSARCVYDRVKDTIESDFTRSELPYTEALVNKYGLRILVKETKLNKPLKVRVHKVSAKGGK